MTTSAMTCKTCKFYNAEKSECCRFPPQIAGIVSQKNPLTNILYPAFPSMFPAVSASSWCGEWSVGLLGVSDGL